MTSVNIYQAKTELSKLVEAAAAGDTIVIAKAGRPMAKLTRVDAAPAPQRLGFLAGQAIVPDDFDQLGADEIAALFQS
ncbi:MAG: type II toxin-antitoxin system prevent-host-death family antitoxin [Micropruina sp.]|uniref:type II toxin-antitoxin system Phd/YefM family antitoxin n=1 Tax=Micropruina sp. TaxID=2737536 RepID=UPI0039E5B973